MVDWRISVLCYKAKGETTHGIHSKDLTWSTFGKMFAFQGERKEPTRIKYICFKAIQKGKKIKLASDFSLVELKPEENRENSTALLGAESITQELYFLLSCLNKWREPKFSDARIQFLFVYLVNAHWAFTWANWEGYQNPYIKNRMPYYERTGMKGLPCSGYCHRTNIQLFTEALRTMTSADLTCLYWPC